MNLTFLLLVAAQFIGYGGPDGSRVYPDAKPATKNFKVAWTAPLPGWGHGQPVAVAGKVFVLVEPRPTQVFPTLLCYDGATGKLLWERPLDHLKAANAEGARRDLEAWFARQAELLKQQFGQAKPDPDKAHHDRAKALTERLGFQYDTWRLMSPYTGWCFTLSCIGEAFGAPVSDGKTVWVNTTWGGYFAFDMDGKPLWTTYAPKKMFHVGGGDTGTQRARSMILHKGLLISDVLNVLRVLDAKTGKLLLSQDLGKGLESMASPTVLTVAGKDVLLSAGPAAFTLPDLKPLKLDGWSIPGMQMLTDPDQRDVVYFCGAGEHCGWPGKGLGPPMSPAAYRFSLVGDTLRAALLWDGQTLGGDKQVMGPNAPWLLVRAGKFYHIGGTVLEALTGKVLAGEFSRKSATVPATRHLLQWANGHVYGFDNKFFTVVTDAGQPVARHPVTTPELTPAQKEVLAWACGSPAALDSAKQRDFSYSAAFTFAGNRIFLRSYMHLICIGE